MRVRGFLIVALGGLLTLCPPALGARRIKPAALEIRARAFPGFAGARTIVTVATAAQPWARHFHETHAEERLERAENAANGFEVGVSETFTTTTGPQASYEVQVFSTRRGAVHEVGKWTTEAMATRRHNPGLKVFRAPGIKGSILVSEFLPRQSESASNVVFAVGRCWLHLGAALEHVSTRPQSNHATVALAKKLDRRMRRICR
jgi:hypothetical protein